MAALALFCSPWAAAQSGRAGALLMEPTGARNIGLGGASDALVDDVTALYSNPAALTSINDYSGYLELERTPARDLKGSAALAIPIQRRATLAVGIRGLQSEDNVNIFRSTNQADFRFFGPALNEEDLVIDVALARRVRPDVSMGVALHYLQFQLNAPDLPQEKYKGVYADFGVRHNSAIRGVVISGTLRNVGGRLSGLSDPELPLLGAIGASYGRLRSTAHYFVVSGEVLAGEVVDPAFRVGAEYWFANLLGFRVGYDGLEKELKNNPYHAVWNAGVSASFHGTMFDLGISFPRNLENARLTAGLRLSFGEGRRRD